MPDVVDVDRRRASRSSTTRRARASQELVRINSATITVPEVRRARDHQAVRPERRAERRPDSSNAPGIIPGLVVRGNGFSLGVAELRFGGVAGAERHAAATSTASDEDQPRQHPRVRRHPRSASRTSRSPSAPSRSTSTARSSSPRAARSSSRAGAFSRHDHRPQRRPTTATPTAAPNDEAIRLAAHVRARPRRLVPVPGRHARGQARRRSSRSRRATSARTPARRRTRSSSSFESVGAKVKIGSLEIAGEARNFAFLGDGTFKTKTGLRRLPGRRLARPATASAAADSCGVRIDAIGDPVGGHRAPPGGLRPHGLGERHRHQGHPGARRLRRDPGHEDPAVAARGGQVPDHRDRRVRRLRQGQDVRRRARRAA